MTIPRVGPPYDFLPAFIASISGSGFPCFWDIASRPISPLGYIELREMSLASVNNDEIRRLYNVSTGEQTTAFLGSRKWVVQARVGAFTRNVRAGEILERIKIRLGKPLSYNQYADQGLALIDWGSTISQPIQADSRMISSSVCEFVFGFRSVDIDTLSESEGWIEQVDSGANVPGTYTS
jgi:hypothetical protein